MPFLDVSEVILDPMFAQTIKVVRRVQTVGEDGVAVNSQEIFNPIGVVTIYGKPYSLLPDAEISKNQIMVHCQKKLRGPSKNSQNGNAPDLVVWHGNNYVVSQAFDWSKYGAGFYAAICELTDIIIMDCC